MSVVRRIQLPPIPILHRKINGNWMHTYTHCGAGVSLPVLHHIAVLFNPLHQFPEHVARRGVPGYGAQGPVYALAVFKLLKPLFGNGNEFGGREVGEVGHIFDDSQLIVLKIKYMAVATQIAVIPFTKIHSVQSISSFFISRFNE